MTRGCQLLHTFDNFDHQRFGIRSRDQHVFSDAEIEAEEFAVSDEIRHRFGLGSSLDKLSHLAANRIGQRFVIRRVELNTLTSASERQQNLGIEARGVAAVLLQMPGGPLQHLANRPLVGRRWCWGGGFFGHGSLG
jgi:hypothetical protein